MIEELKFNYNESNNQCNTFTPSHTRFEVEIERKDTNEKIAFDYQCNTQYAEPCLESCLYAYISDADAYIEAGKDIDGFHDLFGYQKVSDCIEAFEGCKKSYQDLNEFFTPSEISDLRRELEREGF